VAQQESTPKLRRRARAADGFRDIIGGTLGHLLANIGPTLRDDAEGVHQMHKALRAFRAALKLFEPHLEPAAARRFYAELLRFGQMFGTARDWDVFCLDTLPAATVDLNIDQLRDLKLAAEDKRQIAHAVLRDALRSRDFTLLVLGLAAWAEAGAAQPCSIGDDRMDTRLGTVAPSLLDRVAGKAKERGRHAMRLSVEELHALRKSLKKLGCDVEYFRGLYHGRAVKVYQRRCEDLESILGVANDAVVTQRLALKLISDDRPELAKPAGALEQWSKCRGHKALQGLKEAVKDFCATPVFWS
jgi:CHAD domain-containing protein